jgi:ABC-type lipoprotein export system ATPase subunit
MLSFSPAVLIDEIENAGIDRKKALELLVKKEKITLISTHDPLLALMGNRRIVMKNGGIARVIESSPEEKENLKRLEINDNKMANLKDHLRRGEELKDPLSFLPLR